MAKPKLNQNANVLMDPWEAMGTEYVPTYEYYGQIQISGCWMVYPGEKGSGQKPVPFNPQAHADKSPFLQIEARLAVIPDQQLSFPMETRWAGWGQDWNKITMPSIRQLGFVTSDGKCDVKRFNGQWVKFESVEGFQQNRNNPEKGNYKTWQFTAVYPDREVCRQAFLEEHPQSGTPGKPATAKTTIPQAADDDNPMKKAALQFISTTIQGAWKIPGAQYEDVVEKTQQFIDQNAAACAGLTIDSPEVRELLDEVPF